jgi:hypothetical protein
VTTRTPADVGGPIWRPGTGSRWWRNRRWHAYPLLALMALADAYAFWTTLDILVGKDKAFLGVMVIALSLGAVWGAHEIGRMARAARIGETEYPGWLVGGFTTVWLALGLVMYWIRSHQPEPASAGTGTLQLPSLSAGETSQSPFALLLLGLYLLTGALAAGHAYRYSDPRSVELQEAINERKRINRERVRRFYELQRVEGLLEQTRDEQQRESADRDRKNEEVEAWGAELSAQQTEDLIERLGDPAATDAITRRHGLR